MPSMACTARCALGVGVVQQRLPARWAHLPREPVLVLEPTALTLFAAVGGELLPVVVDLVLVGAVDQQRDRLGERKVRTAVQPDEPTPEHRETAEIVARSTRGVREDGSSVFGMTGLGYASAPLYRLFCQATGFAEMDFSFLFDESRGLFAIGYNVGERRRDPVFEEPAREASAKALSKDSTA